MRVLVLLALLVDIGELVRVGVQGHVLGGALLDNLLDLLEWPIPCLRRLDVRENYTGNGWVSRATYCDFTSNGWRV